MRVNRVGWGLVAACVGFITLAVVAPLEIPFFGLLSSRVTVTIAALAAAAVFWLADHFGTLSPPYSSKTLDLRPTPTLVDARRRALPHSPPTTGQRPVSEFFRYLWTIVKALLLRRGL